MWELESSHLAQRSLRLPAAVLMASLSALAVHDDGSLFLGDEQGTVWRLQVCRDLITPPPTSSTCVYAQSFLLMQSGSARALPDCILTAQPREDWGRTSIADRRGRSHAVYHSHTPACQCTVMQCEESGRYHICLAWSCSSNMQLLYCYFQ